MLSAGSCQTSPGGSNAAVPSRKSDVTIPLAGRLGACAAESAQHRFVNFLCYVATCWFTWFNGMATYRLRSYEPLLA